MKKSLFIAMAFAFILFQGVAHAEQITGTVTNVDGYHIDVSRRHIDVSRRSGSSRGSVFGAGCARRRP